MGIKTLKKIPVVLLAVIIPLYSFFVYPVYAEEYNCAEGKHNYVESERKAETTTQNGYIIYDCALCGRKYKDVVFATSHIWSEWIIDEEATCTETGSKHRHCTQADGHDEAQTIPAAGHKYSVQITEPTETEDGYKTYTCSVCGHSYTEPYGTANGHTHKYTETITKEAACENEGIKTYTCENCSDSYTEPIPAAGHNWSDWITDIAAAEGMEGKRHRECLSCGSVMELAIDALPVTPIVPEPEAAPLFNAVDAVVAAVNVGLLSLFAFLIIPDIMLFLWDRRKKKAYLERLEKERTEVDDFGFS